MQMPSASPQGIASLYMGNPGALQKKIQTEQQAKPGLPPDLSKLLALNTVTNVQDAAKRQNILNQLQQLQGPTGQPPTVAQSIQEQAKQKVQSQMLQQQRQQQGLQELAKQRPDMSVPEGTPQPERQPQGIDEIPVEMNLAGGGIVAFAGGESVPDVTRAVLKELGETGSRYVNDPEVRAAVDKLVKERMAGAAPAAAEAAPAAAKAAEAVGRYGEAARAAGQKYGPAITRAAGTAKNIAGPVAAGIVGAAPAAYNMYEQRGFYDDPNVPTSEKAKQAAREAAHTLVPWATGTVGAGMGSVAAPVVGTALGGAGGYALGKGLTSLALDEEGEALKNWRKANAPQAQQTVRPEQAAQQARAAFAQNDPRRALVQPQEDAPETAPSTNEKMLRDLLGGAGAGGIAASPRVAPAATQPASNPLIQKLMNADPEARRLQEEEAYKRNIGAPDTSYMTKMMEEYDAQKKRLEPKTGFAGLAEFASQFAGHGGPSWSAAGARAASSQQALDRQRLEEQLGLTEKQMALGQKKAETERGYKAAVYDAGRKAYDESYKMAFDAAKEQGANDRQASANATNIATTQMQVAETARGHALQARAKLAELLQAERRGDRDEAKLVLSTLTEELKGLQKALADPAYALTSEGKKSAEEAARIKAAIARHPLMKEVMGGVGTTPTLTSAPTGKTVQLKP